jgi:lipopolysaccharide export system permease protein
MRFIQLEKIHEKGLLTGVTIHEFQPDGQLVFSGRAEQARIESGGWRLLEFVQSRFLADQIQVIHEAERFWPTQISTDLVDLFAITPDMLTTVELHEHIEFFRGNGLQSVDYEVMFWRRVSLPATLLVMILLAVPFVFGPLRQVGAWQRMAGGIAVGLAYYLLAASFSSAGKLWALGPAWSALLPTLLVAVAASWGIRRIR